MKKSKTFITFALFLLLSVAVSASAAEISGTLSSGVAGSSGSIGGSVGGGSSVSGTLSGGSGGGSSISGSVSGGSGGGGSSSSFSSGGGGSVLGASTVADDEDFSGTGGGDPAVLGASVSPLFPATGLGDANKTINIAGPLLILGSLLLYGFYRAGKNPYEDIV